MTPPRFKFLILHFLFFCISIYSQTINSIEISGAEYISESNYKNFISLQNSKMFVGIKDSISTRIIRNTGNYGFFSLRIDSINIQYSPDSLFVSLKINLNENSPTEIHKIYFTDIDSTDFEEINSKIDFLEGNIYNKFELENAIKELLIYFEETGFPFAKVAVQSIYFFKEEESYFTNVYLSINKEQKSTIDEIIIDGNEKTKNYVITRALRLQSGEKYSQTKINEIPKLLNRLRFFEPVETPVFYFNSQNKGVLQIKIKEKETNNFDGIVGYVPSNKDNDKGFFTGYVNISLRNLFGTGRASAIRWQQEDRNSQELELKYLEPWLFNYPLTFRRDYFNANKTQLMYKEILPAQ